MTAAIGSTFETFASSRCIKLKPSRPPGVYHLAGQIRKQMPYKITVENKVLCIALSGRITGLDLDGLGAEMKNYEQNVDVIPHRITDMTGIVELAVNYPEVSTLAEKRRELHFPNRFKSAIVAANRQHVGYARMFQTLNDNPQIAIRIFPDEASASEWIASPGDFERA